MKEYAFLRPPTQMKIDALAIDKLLKPHIAKLKASTVAKHTEPWIVILHCSEFLTEAELATAKEMINAIE